MKKRNRLYTLSLAVCASLLLALPAAGTNRGNVSILVEGVPLNTAGTAYITSGGLTMVPLRAVSEALGFTVTWNGSTRTVSITSGDVPVLSGVVVLDPGHGGSSAGASFGGMDEKDLNLSIARQAASLLEQTGLTVLLTRADDRDVGLYDRTAFASLQKADLFVSVHCNASVTNPAAKGIYTAAYSQESPGWTLAEALGQSMVQSTGAFDLGVDQRPDLAVLRTAKMPAALVECGFMSTPEELALLLQPDYQAKLARGIADGIISCLTPGA